MTLLPAAVSESFEDPYALSKLTEPILFILFFLFIFLDGWILLDFFSDLALNAFSLAVAQLFQKSTHSSKSLKFQRATTSLELNYKTSRPPHITHSSAV